MTYCVAVRNHSGLVFLADSRTNAGLDQISTFRKLHRFEVPGDRVMVLLTAGNLAISQAVASSLRVLMNNPEEKNFANVPNMFSAAKLVGDTVRKVHARDAKSLQEFGIEFNVNLIFGGQIKGETPRLFNVYSAGNFIEATIDTPYLQIGEHKYGKPILDRAVKFDYDLQDALKLGLISMDSTMRSNLGVGMPIDFAVIRRDEIGAELNYRIEAGEPYFHDLRERWSAALRKAHQDIPRPPYGEK